MIGTGCISKPLRKQIKQLERSNPQVAYQQIEFKENAILSSFNANVKDKWFLTHNSEIVEFHFIVKGNENFVIRGSSLKNTRVFFEQPVNSTRLNIFLSDGELNHFKYFNLSEIKAKMFRIPHGICSTLTHTLKQLY